jgi:hypothetical protein
MAKKFTVGKDMRGDRAVFIPTNAKLDDKRLVSVLEKTEPSERGNKFFFRMVDSKGKQTGSHGWMQYYPRKKLAKIIGWG